MASQESSGNFSVMSLGSLIILSAFIVITTASIAIQAYNADTAMKNENMYKFNATVLLLVCGLILIPAGCGATYYGATLSRPQ